MLCILIVILLSKYAVSIQGKNEWQAEYIRFLFDKSNKLDAKFIIWFVPRDYDLGWSKLEKMGMDEFFKLWRDTGLLDGNGNPRTSQQIWDAWLKLPRH